MEYELLNASQLAAKLNITPSWIREMTRKRTKDPLPHIRLGKYVRFPWCSPELTAWLKKRMVGK